MESLFKTGMIKMREENLTKNNSTDSLEERLERVHIPTPKELIDSFLNRKKNYGLLFADGNVIKYAPFVSGKNREGNFEIEEPLKIKKADDSVGALLSTQKDIYYNEYSIVCSLFGNFKSKKRYCSYFAFNTQSIIDFGGKIMDAGVYGLFETLTDKALITKDELNKMCECINSLISYKKQLYALVLYNNHQHAIVQLKEKDGNILAEQNRILHYYKQQGDLCQAVFLPELPSTIDGNNYDFSIISCTNLFYLDLNGTMIRGTKEQTHLHRLSLLSANTETAEVIYSGNLNQIILAKINLKDNTAVKKTLVPDLQDTVLALEVVKDRQIHEKLIQLGEKLT